MGTLVRIQFISGKVFRVQTESPTRSRPTLSPLRFMVSRPQWAQRHHGNGNEAHVSVTGVTVCAGFKAVFLVSTPDLSLRRIVQRTTRSPRSSPGGPNHTTACQPFEMSEHRLGDG